MSDRKNEFEKISTHTFIAQEIVVERNKRILTWMASILELHGDEKRNFYAEMSGLFAGANDEEMAKIICVKISPKITTREIDGGRKIITHFHEIAEGWLSNTNEDHRS